MSTLLLVRHGESEWNRSRRLQGQADAPLTELGRRQVLALRPILEGFASDHVFSSDLGRATESVRLLGGKEPTFDAQWREADLGDWTGRDSRELARQDERYQQWRDGTYTPPGAESFGDLRARVGAAVQALPTEGTSLVVTHGGVVRALLEELIGLSPGRIIPASPGSLTVIHMVGAPRLQLYNVTGDAPAGTDPAD